MGFGTKLALFLIVALFAILGATGVMTYGSIRSILIDDGKAQITTGAAQFIRQLDEIERQVASGVSILALDFALRQAVAQHDHDTVVSALRNHGGRVGASRMLLVETDHIISADTAAPAGGSAQPFEYPALLDRAREEGRIATVAVFGDSADWLVVVPVLAPDPIAFVAAVLPLNDDLLARIRSLTGLPRATGLAIFTPDGRWRTATGPIDRHLTRLLPASGSPLPSSPSIVGTPIGETIFLAKQLATPPDSPAVAVVLGYPLSDALRRYRRLIAVLIVGLGSGLAAATVGAWLISRSFARPLELLASYTQRIGAGDYAPPRPIERNDEIGQLSAALTSMARAIADREERIRHQASHEPITGLPNRQALMSTIDARMDGSPASLVVIGLVRLQEIANTVGREIADRLMCDAGMRLSLVFGSAAVGCIGERSFAAYLPGCDAAGALAIGARVIDTFDRPYQEGELTIDASVAVGVATAPMHGSEADMLLRRGEVALNAALHAESRTAVYQAENDPHRSERLSLMSDLRRGLEHGDLQLLYQPKLDLRSGLIYAAEALVRWQHPIHGLISPDAFIGLAEETGNIQYLTRWALQSGLAEAARWRDSGHALRVSINVSVRDLIDGDLPNRVADWLAARELGPERLILEVTESAIMNEPDAAIAVLHRLARQGVAIAIDDFGVGQSSLAYLRRLPVHELKIDKAFVLNLAQDQDDQTIVRSVIDLGHNLDCVVTAEGVQDAASVALLSRFGCDHAQGYFVARPLPASRFIRFVETWPQRGAIAAAAC